MERLEVLSAYRKSILTELAKCAQHLNLDERIDLLGALIDCIRYVFNDEEDTAEYHQHIEQSLYAKYRHRIQYLHKSKFLGYINYSPEHFKTYCKENNLGDHDYYSPDEHRDWLVTLACALDVLKKSHYITDPSQFNAVKNPKDAEKLIGAIPEPENESSEGITRARQAILFFYLFRAAGIKLRIDTTLADAGRLMLKMVNWESKDVNNNGLYKMLKAAPLTKKSKQKNYEDLIWAKKQFQMIGLTEIEARIRKDIFDLQEGKEFEFDD